jgi:hypothetical protein
MGGQPLTELLWHKALVKEQKRAKSIAPNDILLFSDIETITIANLETDCLVNPSFEHETYFFFLDYQQRENLEN